MKVFIVLIAACAVLGVSIGEYTPSLRGAKVYSVIPETDEQLSLLLEYEDVTGYDFLTRSYRLRTTIDILVVADESENFEIELAETQIPFTIRTNDVQEAVEIEAARQRNASANRVSSRSITFDAYYRYDEIVQYLQELAAQYSSVASIFEIGTSYEGRTLYGLKISSGGSNKPAIVIDAGIHAREWIAPAVALCLINQLVEGTTHNDLYEKVDWYIIPVLNPDGYEYSHTNYRLWRKTRSVNINEWICLGADPNRNFDFYWMETGASSDPCDQTYAGSEAFSEPETRAFRDFVLATDNIKLYLAFHSYGEYLLYPWGYASELPDDVEILDALARNVSSAIASSRGTQYTVGSSTNVLYAAAGASDDWMKGVAGVDLSYTLEFSGGGLYGFDLPASEISSVCTENMLGLRVFAEYIGNNFS